MHVSLLIARLLLAAVFAVAGLTKLADRDGSRRAMVGFGVPESLASVVAALLPVGELAVAGALLPASSTRFGALGALVLLAVFAVVIVRSMARGEAPDCHCFGQLHSAPAGRTTLARNLALGGLAAFVVAGGWSHAGPSAVAWISRLTPAGVVALAGGAVLALVVGAAGTFMLALLHQQGRLLLRLDELEARLDRSGVATVARPPARPQQGLPVGAPAPDFSLAGLYGETVTLESLTAAEKPVLLLFTDPGCGPCNALLPQIARWHREHASALTVAVISRGSPDDNRAKIREHGVGGLWLDPDRAVYEAYRAAGTPAAVIVDVDRRIASPVAGGIDRITTLVEQAVVGRLQHGQLPLQSQPQPDVPQSSRPSRLAVGSPAPPVDLRDLAGERVALTADDRDTLVLFWNPHCGFCRRMLADLRAWEDRPPDSAPRLLVISTGSLEDNRAMGLRAPILLDHGFATATTFGASGTPSAVLVDSTSRIASELATGASAVMKLATPTHAS